MALQHKDEGGTAIYNRTTTGQTLYLYSMKTGVRSVYTAQEKANHISYAVTYRLGKLNLSTGGLPNDETT